MNRLQLKTLAGLALLLLMSAAAAPRAMAAEGKRIRWDIATVPCTGPGGSYPCSLNPGGSATALANDCSLPPAPPATNPPFGCTTITLTGSGTFIVPEDEEPSKEVTGGGTWKVVFADGSVKSGRYVVTELIHWEKSGALYLPECGDPICETTDNIGKITEATGGVAVLRVAYSDGTKGVLEFGCAGLADPVAITEGITATKSLLLDTFAVAGINVPPLPSNFPIKKMLVPVMFWNPGVFTYFVEFHMQNRDEEL